MYFLIKNLKMYYLIKNLKKLDNIKEIKKNPKPITNIKRLYLPEYDFNNIYSITTSEYLKKSK
jgi:hypothetical protein